MRKLHPVLMAATVAMLALLLVGIGGLVFDDRVLVGAPIWLKPTKFAVSLVIYLPTVAWLISLLEKRKRLGWWLGTVIAIASLLEMVAIVGQVVRGRQSHFNNATPLDTAIYSGMGTTIAALWASTLGIAILLLFVPVRDRANAWANRLGIFVALIGMSVGFLMTAPAKAQLDSDSDIIGAHSVGVADGGPGLPLVGWSTTGGDLRVGHFIGMHALQALPLLAFALLALSRRFPRLAGQSIRLRLVLTAAVVYAGTVLLVTWQALRGQSLIHPDAVTLSASVLVVLAGLAGLGWSALSAKDTMVAGNERELVSA
jgi:hypothetical protein